MLIDLKIQHTKFFLGQRTQHLKVLLNVIFPSLIISQFWLFPFSTTCLFYPSFLEMQPWPHLLLTRPKPCTPRWWLTFLLKLCRLPVRLFIHLPQVWRLWFSPDLCFLLASHHEPLLGKLRQNLSLSPKSDPAPEEENPSSCSWLTCSYCDIGPIKCSLWECFQQWKECLSFIITSPHDFLWRFNK